MFFETKTKYHSNLANYFQNQTLFFDGDMQKQPNIRKCMELPWQQTKAELWDDVTETLCNLDFIQAKACAKQTYDLVEDFNMVLEVIPDNQKNIERERKRQRQLNLYKKNCVDNFKKDYNEIEIIQSIEIKRKPNYWLTNSNFKNLNFRLDLLQIYGRFIRNNVYNLTKYCEIKSYVLQLAYNQENQALRKFIEKDKNKLIHNGNLFLQLERSPDYDKNFYQIEAKIYGPNTGSKTYRPHINNFFVDVANQNIFISAVNKFQKWDFKNSVLLKEFNSFDTYITAMAFNLNSNIGFFSTGAPKDRVKKICLYDIEKEECIFSSNEHNENILKVALTDDARYGYSQGYKKIIIWNFKSKSNSVVKELSLNFIGAGKQKIIFLNNFEILFWEKGDLIFFDLDKDIVLDKITIELIDTFNYAIYSTPDRSKILIHSDNLVYFVDRIAKNIEIINVNKSSIHYDLKITADGQKIFMFCDENIYLFEIGKDLKPFIIYSHDNKIVQFEISTDAKYGFILGEAENYIEVINFEEHEEHFQKTNLDYDVCFNKRFGNGEYRLIVKNKTLKILKNESTIREILFSNYATNDNVTFDFSQNGRYLALAVSDAKVNLYDVKSDNNRLTTVPNESDITSVCISPDCKSLASVSFSRELMIFKLPNCLLLKKIKIKKYKYASQTCYSPDGELLAVSDYKDVILLDTKNYLVIKRISIHDDLITSVTFSLDGHFLVTGGNDKIIKFYDFKRSETINILNTKGNAVKLSTDVNEQRLYFGEVFNSNYLANSILTYNFMKTPITTIMKTWNQEQHKRGIKDQTYSYFCPCCENKVYDEYQILRFRKFLIKSKINNLFFKNINSYKEPYTIACKICGRNLQINLFTA